MCLSGAKPVDSREYGFTLDSDGYIVIDTSLTGPKRLQDLSAVDCVRFLLAINQVSPKMLRDVADGIEMGRDVPEGS